MTKRTQLLLLIAEAVMETEKMIAKEVDPKNAKWISAVDRECRHVDMERLILKLKGRIS